MKFVRVLIFGTKKFFPLHHCLFFISCSSHCSSLLFFFSLRYLSKSLNSTSHWLSCEQHSYASTFCMKLTINTATGREGERNYVSSVAKGCNLDYIKMSFLHNRSMVSTKWCDRTQWILVFLSGKDVWKGHYWRVEIQPQARFWPLVPLVIT